MPMYVAKPKIKFDPTSSDHLKIYNKFLKTKHWSEGCPFHLEWPYANIPAMVERKIIDHHLDRIILSTKKK